MEFFWNFGTAHGNGATEVKYVSFSKNSTDIDATLNITVDFHEQLSLRRQYGFASIFFRHLYNDTYWKMTGPGQITTKNVLADDNGLVLQYNGSNKVHFMSNGNLGITGSYYGNCYITTSDDRINFNEKPIIDGLKIIKLLKPITYDKSLELNKEIDTFKEAGFLAQDVFKIPELKPSVTEGNENLLWNINYNCILPFLASAIQELNNTVHLQKQTIDALMIRLEVLENNQELNNTVQSQQQTINEFIARLEALENKEA